MRHLGAMRPAGLVRPRGNVDTERAIRPVSLLADECWSLLKSIQAQPAVEEQTNFVRIAGNRTLFCRLDILRRLPAWWPRRAAEQATD